MNATFVLWLCFGILFALTMLAVVIFMYYVSRWDHYYEIEQIQSRRLNDRDKQKRGES